MDPKLAHNLQKQLQDEVKELNSISKQLNALVVPRSKILSQYQENDMVKKELEILDDDAEVYKLIGPVLVKQEVDDAKKNVDRRLEYLKQELERINKSSQQLTGKQTAKRKQIMKIQEIFRSAQQAAVAKAQAAN